jgi:hypothetical protein
MKTGRLIGVAVSRLPLNSLRRQLPRSGEFGMQARWEYGNRQHSSISNWIDEHKGIIAEA